MTSQEYIQNKLATLKDPIKLEAIEPDKLEKNILSKVLSKKFRKYAADEAAIDASKCAIHLAVSQKRPVKLGLLFGGNKIWRLDEAPEVDWAELFSLMYYTQWMKSIACVYKYGVEFSIYSQDVSIQRLNNIPRSETDNYSKTFRELLIWLKQYLPKEVSFTYGRHAEEYSDLSRYDDDINEAKKVLFKELNNKYPVMSDEEKRRTEFNVRLKPGQADDPLWREKVELEHKAIFRVKSLLPYLNDNSMIHLSAMPFSGYIAVGSTKHSVAKFWASVGVLQQQGNSYIERDITPKQLDVATYRWEEMNFDIKGKNFSKIRVLTG